MRCVDMERREAREYFEWSCPYCGTRYRAPRTAALSTTCQNCGGRFFTRGIEVENKESRKFDEEIRKRRKKEIEADKEHE